MASNFDPPNAIPANAGTCPGSPFIGCAPQWRFPDGWETASNSPWSNDAQHPPGAEVRKSESYALQLDADLGLGTLTVLPAYARHRNTLYSSFLFGSLTGPYTAETGNATYTPVEVRLASAASSRVTWLVGGYYLKSEGGPTFSGQTTSDPSIGTFVTDQTYAPGKTLAAFGQLTYPVTDALRVTAGLRYSQDKQGTSFQIAGDLSGGGSYDSGPTTFSENQPSTTYKAGFEYDLAARSMLYGHVATGFSRAASRPPCRRPASTRKS